MAPRSGRRRGRYFRVRVAQRWVNELFAFFSYLELGCPKDANWEGRLGPPCINPDAHRRARLLLPDVLRFGRSGVPSGPPDGGARARLSEALERCAQERYQRADDSIQQICGALQVDPRRISMPSNAGSINICDHLSPPQLKEYSDLGGLVLPEGDLDEAPQACHMVAPGDEDELSSSLLTCNMARLVPEEDLPRRLDGQLLIGGFFAVAKSGGRLRLIFDRRPQNSRERRFVWIRLPAAALMTRLVLEPNEVVRGCGRDLKDFYFQLAHSDDRLIRNAVGRRVSQRLVKKFGKTHFVSAAGKKLTKHTRCRMALRVAGMGDLNTVDVTTSVHENVLRKRNVLEPSCRLLQYGKRVPRDKLWVGVYIDDLLTVLRVDRRKSRLPNVDSELVARADSAYEAEGFPQSGDKAFNMDLDFKAWGCEMRGGVGRAAWPLQCRSDLAKLTLGVLQIGWASCRLLQQLLGLFAAVFVFKREMFSVFHHIFKFVDGLSETPWTWTRLPAFILDELRAAMLLLPLAESDLRAPLSTNLWATDATPTAGGAVSCEVPKHVIEKLYEISEQRGAHVRLDGGRPGDEDHLKLSGRSSEVGLLALSLPWTVRAQYRFRHISHINLQEARALVRELKEESKHTRNPIRQVILTDSMVCLGAVAKGRSSSFRLNGVLRCLLPYLVSGRITIALIWIPTDMNPSDDPSRDVSLRAPVELPRGIQELFGWAPLDLENIGYELFAGSAGVTKAFRECGFCMRDPVDVKINADCNLLSDVFLAIVLGLVGGRRICFVWMSPPCTSFSALQNGHKSGPWRSKEHPEGIQERGEITEGNELWARTIAIANACLDAGVDFVIEHPATSYAWGLPSTRALRVRPGVSQDIADMCMYSFEERPNKKPLKFLFSRAWLGDALVKCDGSHTHGPHLCGKAASASARYPAFFCSQVASSYARWQAATAPTL